MSERTLAGGGEFFSAGGTLQAGAPCYVQRRADRELAECLDRGELCYVLTARQCGKSSLLVRTVRRLRAERRRIALVDLTSLGQLVTPLQWYVGLRDMVGEQLDSEDALEEAWDELSGRGPSAQFFGALQRLAARQGPITICLDEVDYIRSLPFLCDEFFAGVRALWNARADNPGAAAVNFCLVGVAAPSDLIRDPLVTPFNVGRRIELTDFTLQEALPLSQGFSGNKSNGNHATHSTLQRVLHWTGGQPYLTQRLCLEVASSVDAPAPRQVDRCAHRLFLGEKARDRDSNLTGVRDQLLHTSEDRAALLDLYLHARNGGHAAPVGDPVAERLLLSGIVATTPSSDGQAVRLRVRNRIYARVFDRNWVRQSMPDAEVRRQAAAFRRGVMRTALAAGILGSGLLGLAAWALAERDRAESLNAALSNRNTELQNSLRAEKRALQTAKDARAKETVALKKETVALKKESVARQRETRERRRAEQSERQLARDLLGSMFQEGSAALEDGDGRRAQQAFLKAAKLDPSRSRLHRLRSRYAMEGYPRSLWHGTFDGDLVQADLSPDGRRAVIVINSAPRHESPEQTPGDAGSAHLLDLTRPSAPPVRLPHAGSVEGVGFLHGGRTLFTLVRRSREVRLWSSDGRPGPTLRLGEGAGSAAAVRGEPWLLAAGEDGELTLWDETGRRLGGVSLPTLVPPAAPRIVEGGVVGGSAYVGWSKGAVQRIRLPFSAEEGRLEFDPAVPGDASLNSMWSSDDGRWQAVRSDAGAVCVQRIPRFQLRKELTPSWVEAADFCTGSRFFLTVQRRQLKAWDLTDSDLRTISWPETFLEKCVLATSVSRPGWFMVVRADGSLRFWQPVTNALHTVRLRGTARFARCFPSMDRLVVEEGGRVECLDLRDTVERLAFSEAPGFRSEEARDGRHVLSWSARGEVQVHLGNPGPKPLARVQHGSNLEHALLSPAGDRLLTWGSDAGRVLWEIPSGREIKRWTPFPLEKHHVNDAAPRFIGPRHAFSPDGSLLAMSGPDYAIRIVRAVDGIILQTLSPAADDRYRYADLHWSGRTLAGRRETGTVRVWIPDRARTDAWTLHLSLRTNAAVASLAAGGRTLAFVSETGSVEVWDTAGRRRIARFAQPGRGDAIALDPTGSQVAAGSEEGMVRVWSVAGPVRRPRVLRHEAQVAEIHFAPDGRTLATRTHLRRNRVWDLDTETLIRGPHGRSSP